MKDRITVRHGMLGDLRQYLIQSGWTIEAPVGEFEVLRARRKGYPRPLLVYNRSGHGCGYSIDERLRSTKDGRRVVGGAELTRTGQRRKSTSWSAHRYGGVKKCEL